MIKIAILVAAALVTSVLHAPDAGAQELHPARGADGFVTLFDGGNLDHWKMGPDRSWKVVDGEIRLDREFDGREHNLDYLWTREQYGDFVLDLEFKIPERANSGVFLRTPDLKDPVYTGIEVQVANSYGRAKRSKGGCAGAIYDCLAPTANTILAPGQWNRYTITCRGPKISVVLNGKQIIDMNLDQWTEPHRNPDGTKNKFPRALKDFARKGHIGLQDHGRPIAYRNVRVKRLEQNGAYKLKRSAHGMVLEDPEGGVVFQYLTSKPPNSNLAASSTSCFHPVNTPRGIRVTDLAPGDHHHHRGIFLAWHTMQFQWPADFSKFGPTGPTEGVNIARGDFWGWGQYAPTDGVVIKNQDVRLIEATPGKARLRMTDAWMIHDTVMMMQVTRVDVRKTDNVYVIDLDYQLTPRDDKELLLNHSSFGGFCVRARADGASYYADAAGKVTLPDPWHSVPKLNWPPRPWYDYTITLNNDQPDNGKTIGCTVIDHPENPPSTWHNPRYIYMINPCIVARGPVTVKAKDTLRLRYRILTHDGPTPKETIERLAAEYGRQ